MSSSYDKQGTNQNGAIKNLFTNFLQISRRTKKDKPSENSQDYISDAIGVFGLWQAASISAVGLTRFIVIWNLTTILFLTPDTDFVCVELSEPVEEVSNSTCYDNCLTYEYHNQGLNTTLISDFGLICDRQWLASLTQSVLMFGVLLGATLFGWMSDRYGRRLSLIVSTIMNVTFMLATPLSHSYWVFSCFRFINGVAVGGALTIPIVYVMEMVGKDHREVASCVLLQPDGLAQASLAIFAYYSPTWNVYAFGYSIATIIILILILFVPESPRWLMSNGRIDEAIEVITKAAKRNKRETSKIKDNIKKFAEELKIQEKETVGANYLDFFRNKDLALKLFSVFMVWSVSGTCFFGINQYLTFVGSNLYITVIVLGLIQLPVGVIAWLLNKTFGRKNTSIGILATTAVVMILLIFSSDYYWATALLGVIGFGAINSIFGVIYVYVSELFPTPMRNMAVGAASIGSKFGAMIAPFVASLRPQWLPCVIFAAILFVAVGCCSLLPETKGQPLKDTIE